MAFKLENNPLELVVCTMQLSDHPDINSLVGKVHDDLLSDLFSEFSSQTTPNMKIHFSGNQTSPSVTQTQQNVYTDKDKTRVLRFAGKELSYATREAYVDFEHYLVNFKKLITLLKDFPPVVGVSMRYVNKVEAKSFPSPHIIRSCQGLMSDKCHNHFDMRMWNDLGNQRSTSLMISATSPHGPSLPASISVPPQFLERLKNESQGLLVDLAYVFNSSQLKFDNALVEEVDSQRRQLASLFESIMTEQAKLDWKYKEVPE